MKILLTIFIAFALSFFICITNLDASEFDRLVHKLEQDNWQDVFYKKGEINKYKDAEGFKTLVEVAENKGLDWHIRIKAIRILSNTNNIAVPDVLMHMLYNPFFNHECPAIKSSVAEALGNFKGDGRVIEALIYATNDEELLVREAAVDSLGRIGDKRAVKHLVSLLNHKNIAIRIASIRALGRIGDASAKDYLLLVAEKDSNETVRKKAKDTIKLLH